MLRVACTLRFAVLATLLLTFSLAAELVPVSVVREGLAGGGVREVQLASNGSSFLAVWDDDRNALDASLTSDRWSGQAMRLAADGTPLDAQSIALPGTAEGVVWAGTGWVVLTRDGLTRIDAGGRVLETVRFPAETDTRPLGIAWTGDAFVVVFYVYSEGLRTLTFDREFNVVRIEELPDVDFTIPLLAGDGRSALMVWRGRASWDESRGVRVVSFGRDGLLQGTGTIEWQMPGGLPVALGTTGESYVVAGRSQLGYSALMQAVQVERDLTSRQIFTSGFPAGAEWPYEGPNIIPQLVWDGTLRSLYTVVVRAQERPELQVTRFTAKGRIAAAWQRIGEWTTDERLTSAAAANGSTLLASAASRFTRRLSGGRLRVLLPGGTLEAPAAVERGALPQQTPAGASSATQSLVVWTERSASDAMLSLQATRLDVSGTVLDPESLLLGRTSCHDFHPAAASDGRDFVAVWFDASGLRSARIGADGVVTSHPATGIGSEGCGSGALQLASNGSGYLAVWQNELELYQRWEIYALRLQADGTPVDGVPFLVTRGETNPPRFPFPLHLASNGHDYLVAWLDHAVRVTAEGLVLDRERPILLGGLPLGAWWNGREYVVWNQRGYGWNAVRVDAGGSPEHTPVHIRWSHTFPASTGVGELDLGDLCDSAGCTVPFSVVTCDGSFAVNLLRFEDRGSSFSVRMETVPGSAPPPHDGGYPAESGAVRVRGGPLVVLRTLAWMEKPYSGAHRIFVTRVGPARGRVVRK